MYPPKHIESQNGLFPGPPCLFLTRIPSSRATPIHTWSFMWGILSRACFLSAPVELAMQGPHRALIRRAGAYLRFSHQIRRVRSPKRHMDWALSGHVRTEHVVPVGVHTLPAVRRFRICAFLQASTLRRASCVNQASILRNDVDVDPLHIRLTHGDAWQKSIDWKAGTLECQKQVYH